MKNKKNEEKLIQLLVGVMLFLVLRPYFTWGIGGNLAQIIFSFPLAFMFWWKNRFSQVNILHVAFFLFILVLASICQKRNMMGAFSMVILLAIPFSSREFMLGSYEKFKTIYAIVISISLLVWFLVILNVGLPGRIILPLNTMKDYNYIAYPLLVVPNYISGSMGAFFQSFRFCGPFDEPGVIGTLAGLFLYIDRFNLKDKRNIPILISGIVSFSLFFYIIASIYIIIKIALGKAKVWYKILTVLIVGILFAYSKQNEVTNYLIWNRLEYDKTTGNLSGDNRATSRLKTYYNSIQGTSEYWWGVNNRSRLAYYADSAGYRNAILSNGAIVCIAYVFFFMLLAVRKMKNFLHISMFTILFLTTLYQRPGLFLIIYLYLFTMYIVMHDRRFGRVR